MLRSVLMGTTALVMALAGTAQAAIPKFDHVVIVVMENESRAMIIGNASAPYINSLAGQGTNFTNYHAITHPSQPNYIAMFSGSTHGVTDDSCPVNLGTTPNLASQLIASGRTFKGYADSMPSNGYTGCSSGNYRRKHNPWVNFSNVPSSSNLTFTSFPTDYTKLPTVSMIVPDMCHDMHDCSIATGDTWLKNNIDKYAQWAKTHNSLLVLTWDEDDGSASNQIATIFVGANVKVGTSSTAYNHYSLLRTLEDMYGLPILQNAAGASAIDGIWGSSSTTPPPPTTSGSDTLSVGSALSLNQSIFSSDGAYKFTLQGDGNLVIRRSDGQAVWAANTQGKGGTRLAMQTDGNLVLYTSAGVPVWSTKTYGTAASMLVMQSDGNLVLYSSGGAAIWATGTNNGSSGGSTPPKTGTSFAQPVKVGTVQSAAMVEVSGCTASRTNSGVLWMHNDSGDSARIFAVNTQGTLVGLYNLTGASAADYEDIAVGPGPVQGKSYIYVGDIGDNGASRTNKQVYRIVEPSQLTTSGSAAAEKFTLVYPDGPRDAETLMVDPLDGDMYVVSKREASNRVYRFKGPFTNGSTYTGEIVAHVNITWLTGGEISPDGGRILLRTGSNNYLWLRNPGESVGSALSRNPISIPAASERQGEAICWDRSGSDYYTTSEGKNQPIYLFKGLD
ncbi:MAG TPA: alkaline phosphatase family protein [Aquabacterium sp.]|nr:alkaline phosphatase family protein [Aquabacterium sp.]